VRHIRNEYTQILNYLQLIGSLEKQVMMVENQLTQIADMAKHGSHHNQLFGRHVRYFQSESDREDGPIALYTMGNLDEPSVCGSWILFLNQLRQSYQTWSQTSLDSTLAP